MKRLVILIALAMVATMVGCAPTSEQGERPQEQSLKIAGSTTVLPLSQLWAERYMGEHPEVSISVSGGGTGTGISMLLNGTCDVANASREAKEEEIAAAEKKGRKLVATKVARDGIAVVVNPANKMESITIEQLAAIYNGKAITWNEAGGESKDKIVVVGRDTSSGTYGFFQDEVLGGSPYRKDMLSQSSNAALAQAVAQSPVSIGYVGLAYAEDFAKKGKVKVLAVARTEGEKGIVPNEETIKSGEYPLFRYLFNYTLGEPTGAAGDFMAWCTGPDGQGMVTEAGYLPAE